MIVHVASSEQKQKGKKPEELLSPDSPDYLLKNLDQYVRSNREIVADLVRSNKKGPIKPIVESTPIPRLEGESAIDYMKRIGK